MKFGLRMWAWRSPALYGGVLVSAAAVFAGAGPAWTSDSFSGIAPVVDVGTETPATTISLQHERAQNSPALAAHPEHGEIVVMAYRVDGPQFDCALAISGDSGATWMPLRPVPRLPAGAERCYAPEVVFDADGTLYYLFVGLHGPGNRPMGAFLTTSSDIGRTFDRPRQILGPDRFMVRLAVDGERADTGRVHLVWLEPGSEPLLGGLPSTPSPLLASFSDDGGRTFSRPQQVNDPSHRLVVAPALVIGQHGAVHVAYYDLKDDVRDYQGLEGPAWEGTWSVVIATSTDGRGRFEDHSVIDIDVVPPERVMLIFTMPPPALAADASGNVYAAWTDRRHGDWDVVLRHSSDGGRSWGRARVLNDDGPGAGRHQYLPRIAVAPNGRLDAIFYDRRDDPENVRNHVYYTFSSDRATTFSPNLRLTSETSDSRTGARYAVPSARGLVEFGSRTALVSDRSRVLAAWTDTRLPHPGLLHQDVFTTDVIIEENARVARGPILFTLLCGAVVVGFAIWRLRRAQGPRRGEGSHP